MPTRLTLPLLKLAGQGKIDMLNSFENGMSNLTPQFKVDIYDGLNGSNDSLFRLYAVIAVRLGGAHAL